MRQAKKHGLLDRFSWQPLPCSALTASYACSSAVHSTAVRRAARLKSRLVQHPLPGVAAAAVSLADQRRNHALRLDAAAMRPAVRWVSFLLGRWRSQLSEALTVVHGAAVGERLALVVCSHSLRLHSARRRLLRDDAAFEKRSRDPVPDDA